MTNWCIAARLNRSLCFIGWTCVEAACWGEHPTRPLNVSWMVNDRHRWLEAAYCIMRRWKSSWFELVLTARLSSSVTVVTSKARSHLIRWKEHAYLTKRETENKLVLEARRSDLNNWRKRCTATGCQDIWGGTIMHHHDETETAVKKLWPIYLLSSEQQNGCAVFRNLLVARQGLLAPPLLGACAHGYQQLLLDARANLLTILHSSPLLEMIEIVKFLLEWKQRMMEYWGHPTDTINKNNNSIMWSKQLTTVASNSA